MFGIRFGAAARTRDGETVTIRLNARLQPMHRGEHFEDPLTFVLSELSLGEITGGGTELSGEGGVAACDIEVTMPDAGGLLIETLIAALEELGAPKGSKVRVESTGAETPFGAAEGLALVLNGTGLPDEVYASCDVNHVIAELDRLMGEEGRFMSYWEGPTDTALYCYGRSFEAMRAAIDPLLADYPLCRQARVERIA